MPEKILPTVKRTAAARAPVVYYSRHLWTTANHDSRAFLAEEKNLTYGKNIRRHFRGRCLYLWVFSCWEPILCSNTSKPRPSA